MSVFTVPILKYLLISQFCFLFTYFIGKIVKNIINKNKNYNILEYVEIHFFGYLTISVLFAIFTTKFNTLYLLIFILAIIILIYHQIKLNFKLEFNLFSNEKKLLSLFFFINIIIFLLLYYNFFIYSNAAVVPDNYFYSKVTKNIIENNIESWFFWIDNGGASSYHYQQFWFNGFFTKIFNINNLHGYYFLYPVFFINLSISSAFMLLKYFFSKFNLSYFYIIIASLIFLIIQIPDIPFSDRSYLGNFFFLSSYTIMNIKAANVLVAFSIAFVLIKNKSFEKSFYYVLISPILFPTILPATFTGIFAALVYIKYLKIINFKKYSYYNFLLFFSTIFYWFIYHIQKYIFPVNNLKIDDIVELQKIKFYDSLIKIWKINFVLIIICIITSIILFYVYKYLSKNQKYDYLINIYKKNKIIIHTFIVFTFCGISIVFLIFPIVNVYTSNTFQLLAAFIVPIYTIILFFGLNYLILYQKIINKNIIIVVALIYFWSLTVNNEAYFLNLREKYVEIPIDFNYYKIIKEKTAKFEEPKFAYYRDYTKKIKENAFYALPYLFLPDLRITHFYDDYFAYSLNPYDIPNDLDYRMTEISYHPLIRYMNKKTDIKNIETITINFLKTNKINFIIFEDNYRVPKYLEKYIISSTKNNKNNNVFTEIEIN